MPKYISLFSIYSSVLYCYMYPECSFKGFKKQEMINHFFKAHKEAKPSASVDNTIEDIQNESKSPVKALSDYKMSHTKQSQLEVNKYYFIDKEQFQLAYDYYYKFIYTTYKPLLFIEEFIGNQAPKSNANLFKSLNLNHFVFNLKKDLNMVMKNYHDVEEENEFNLFFKRELNLNFQFNDSSKENAKNFKIELKPFEIFQSKNQTNDPFLLINMVKQLTAMDWCPTLLQSSSNQYLAFSSLSFEQLSDIYPSNNSIKLKKFFIFNQNYVKSLFDSPNFIFITKFENFTNSNQENKLFAIFDTQIGNISSLKWRPDFGASLRDKYEDKTEFIGHLLATSSNGNAYILSVSDMTVCGSFKNGSKTEKLFDGNLTKIEKLNAYEFNKKIVLKLRFPFGQCTSGDWSQSNGAHDIALGYANGSVALFRVRIIN